MYNFGPNPPRALESFGVAGLLDENCRVYYDNLFGTRNIGRISDLVSAKLRSAGLDDLRLRAILLFGTFEGYYNPGLAEETAGQVMIECGVDQEKVAVGFSFLNRDLAKKIAVSEPLKVFSGLLATLHSQADRVVVRVLAESGKVEIVALLGIPAKMTAQVLQTKAPIETVVLARSSAKPTPSGEFIQLADLDYASLLREENPAAKLPPPATGVIQNASAPPGEAEPEIHFAGEQPGFDSAPIVVKDNGWGQETHSEPILVAGASAAAPVVDSTSTWVRGTAPPEAPEAVPVSGDAAPSDQPAESIQKIAVKLGASPDLVLKIQEQFRSQTGAYQQKVTALEEQIKNLRSEKAQLATQAQVATQQKRAAELDSVHAERLALSKLIPSFLKKWPFSKSEGQPADPEVQSAAPDLPITTDSGGESQIQETAPEGEFEELKMDSLERMVNKAAMESKEIIRTEIATERAKVWVDGMMGELLSEKAQLTEKAKKLNNSIRQKEFAFQNRQVALSEELKRREDLLRQKDHQIARLKDQISEMTIIVERSKSGSSGSAEVIRLKQRFEMSQKMLAAAKAENTQMISRIEELRSQLATLQQSTKSSAAASAELSSMRMRYDHLNRQCEEFRKANHLLSEKLAIAKREKTVNGGSAEELRRRLEMAMQTATGHQKDAEESKLKVEELKREELRLKMELGRAQTEVKGLRAALSKGQKPGAPGGKAGGARAA